jgi:ATP:ADP antiporter, AAA family
VASTLNLARLYQRTGILNPKLPKRGLGKLFLMSALMFCILCNQSVLRVLKDAIVVSRINAEVTDFIKLYCVLPCAASFVVLYNKMADSMPYTKVYYSIVSAFLCFFLLFAFVIYPNAAAWHTSADLQASLIKNYPSFKWYFLFLCNWSYTIFYIFAELWPDVAYVFMFWQLANRITETSEAKQFYPALAFFGNFSLVLIGFLVTRLSCPSCWIYEFFPGGANEITLVKICVSIVAIAGLLSMYLVHIISVRLIGDPNLYHLPPAQGQKMTMLESFRYVARSKYLWLIVICSTAFYCGMNLVEALWKAKIKQLYPTVEGYSRITSLCVIWTGVVTMTMSIASKVLMEKMRLKSLLLIAPTIMSLSGMAFFFVSNLPPNSRLLPIGWVGLSALHLAVIAGAVQNVLAKGVKYSIWDTSKEMLYIPLDQTIKTKGKAAADLIGSKFGKSAGSLVRVGLLSYFHSSSYDSIAPVMTVMFVCVSLAWIWGSLSISKEYHKMTGYK